jgi:carbamoyltransferase
MNKRDDVYFLGIHCGHNASCAVMKNGKIIAAAQEERFSRKKNDTGYPRRAIDYCLSKARIRGADLCRAAYTTREYSSISIKSRYNVKFSLKDYFDYYGPKFYNRKLSGENCLDYLKWLRDDAQFNPNETNFDFSYLTDAVLLDHETDVKLFNQERLRTLSEHLGLNRDKIDFLDHHTCHAYYAYFGSPFRSEDCIVITLDGWGDGRNQTVWSARHGQLELIADSNQNDVGNIYSMATLILGMRPDEHEFKVMGLAPYAKGPHVQEALAPIKDLLHVRGLRIEHKNRPKNLFKFLQESWQSHRFDNIAAAVQQLTESILTELVTNIKAETGIGRMVVSGGIAQNIKLNMAIAELPCVDSLYVCPSAADESLSLGGCYYLNRENNNNLPLTHVYLGYDIGDDFRSVNWSELSKKYVVEPKTSAQQIAALLAKGDILARINGSAEFGARALGNRSILANPSNPKVVEQINRAIKNRDFWMPFALSIIEEHADRYIVNPKKIKSPFMCIGFNTRPEQYNRIHAGTHPYDKTVRPQFVSTVETGSYYEIINAFFKITGIPAILNTSFNLHGEPIVNTIADAVRTFELSGLRYLLIGDTLLSKR